MIFRLGGIHAGQHVRQNHSLFPQRGGDESVHLTAVLGTLTHRVDECFILTTHLIVDDDPTLHDQTGATRDLDVRADTRGHHDHVGRQRIPRR